MFFPICLPLLARGRIAGFLWTVAQLGTLPDAVEPRLRRAKVVQVGGIITPSTLTTVAAGSFGSQLIEEPFWIGAIILAVLLIIFGMIGCLRKRFKNELRRCAAYFTTKRIRLSKKKENSTTDSLAQNKNIRSSSLPIRNVIANLSFKSKSHRNVTKFSSRLSTTINSSDWQSLDKKSTTELVR